MDPFKILKGMAPLLCQNGGIRGEEEAITIASLMRDANKMVSKCIYVNVLKSTDGQDILEKFLIHGGWDIMNDWLRDARQSENTPLLMEILRVYHTLPVTIDIMKKNDAAKTIKQLRKSEDDGIKNLAGGIVDQWMKKIREKSNLDTSNDQSLKKKKKKHKDEKVKVELKEKKYAEYDNNRKREVPIKEEPPQPESMDSEQSVMDNKFINKVPDKAPKEERKRPNTVKSYPSKFRSTGLEEATIILPKKKPSTDPVKLVPKRQLPSGELRLLDAVLEKKPRLTISTPLNPISVTTISSSPSTITSSVTTTTTTSSGLVSSPTDLQKNIKTPPRISRQSSIREIHDSSGFMDALTSAGPTTGLFRRKKKVPPVTSKTSQPSAVGQKLPQLPCFYRETLETTEDVKVESESSPSEEKNGDSTNDVEMKEEVNEESPSSRDGISGEQPENSNDSSSAVQAALVRRKPKKTVTWADDGKNDETHLRQIFYFELDETERENVNRPKDFDAMKKEEMLMDRRAVKRLCHDTMKEQMAWQKLLLFEGHILTDTGRNSLEKDIQKQREQGVLQALYFFKHMLPDAPTEPDLEPVVQEEHKAIPLEDEHASVGEEQEYSYDHSQELVTPIEGLDQGATPGVNLPPELANLMASLQPQIQSPPPPQDITPIIDHSPSPVVANVQNLLFSLMGNSGNEYGKQDEMTEKLKQILEPLKNQLPGLAGPPMQPPQDYPPEYIDNWHEGPLDCPPPGARCPNPGLQGMPGPPGPFGPCPPGPGLGPGLGVHGPGLGPGPGPGPGPGFGPGPGLGPGPGHGPGPGCGPGPGPGPGHGHGPGPGCGPGPGPGPGPCQDQGPGPGHMRGNRSGRNYPPRNNRSMPQGMRGRQGRNGRDLPKICRHFTSPNGCRYGSNCAFLHPGINGPPL